MKPSILKNGKTSISKVSEIKYHIKKWTALGSIIIFFSWIAQNFFQEEWRSGKEQADRDKLAIGLCEINKNQFKSSLLTAISNGEREKVIDENILLSSYYYYCVYTNQLHVMGAIFAAKNDDEVKKNELVYEQNKLDLDSWLKKRDLSSLQDFSIKLDKWEAKNGTNVVSSYQNKIKTIRDKEDFWGKIYIFLYFVGVLCLSRAFISEYKLIEME